MFALFLSSCLKYEEGTYTLYRNSPVDPNMRIFFATFNSTDKGGGSSSEQFNSVNCNLASDVLNENVKKMNGGNLIAKFWCEKGVYKK